MLANYMKLVLYQNQLLGGQYVEPYAGGAAVAWSLLFEEYVSAVHINDINPAIYAFWISVTEHTDELCRLISDTTVSIDEWHKQREVQEHQPDYSVVSLGFSTFFLNRTNRAGVLKGGVIGGKAQSGSWKLDARFNKSDLISRIYKIAQFSNWIRVYNEDALVFINTRVNKLPNKSLVYLDPPYYGKGAKLYENSYRDQDHADIASAVKLHIKQPWIVSYDDTPRIRELYSGVRDLQYRLSYSVHERYQGSEIMFFSDKLVIPSIQDPTRVRLSTLHSGKPVLSPALI